MRRPDQALLREAAGAFRDRPLTRALLAAVLGDGRLDAAEEIQRTLNVAEMSAAAREFAAAWKQWANGEPAELPAFVRTARDAVSVLEAGHVLECLADGRVVPDEIRHELTLMIRDRLAPVVWLAFSAHDPGSAEPRTDNVTQ